MRTEQDMTGRRTHLEQAEWLLDHCGEHAAPGPVMIAAAQVHVMIEQARIAQEVSWCGSNLPPEQMKARATEPERMDPAITELLDRAADLLGAAGEDAHTPKWEEMAGQWMTDWRAYMHSAYHRRQPW